MLTFQKRCRDHTGEMERRHALRCHIQYRAFHAIPHLHSTITGIFNVAVGFLHCWSVEFCRTCRDSALLQATTEAQR